MGTTAITQVLTIGLIVSIIILFILIVVFFALWFKNKMKKNEQDKQDSKEKVEEKRSNTFKSKIYTATDVKSFMDFDEIKDNMIVQNNGKRMVMVVQCQGINYDLMSSIEKVGVEQGFIQFLNTLTRPIQIYIQSRKVNLEESIDNYKKRFKNIDAAYNKAKLQYQNAQKNTDMSSEKFKKIKFEYVRQKNLHDYTKDIIANTESMSLNKNILTKKYYIAISYFPENPEELFKKEELIDLAFSELYTSAQSVLRGLSMCGITGKVLDSEELAELLYVSFNRDASELLGLNKALKAGYDSLYTTAPDVFDKKMKELDKIIEERAVDLVNSSIEEATVNNIKKKEVEEKEKNMADLIKQLAKTMIEDNRGYIPDDIADESIEIIENKKEQTKSKTKKGA